MSDPDLSYLPGLIPAQQALVDLPFAGRIFLRGPAGCGKTLAAVARLNEMLRQGVSGEHILILTPQRMLAEPYERLLRSPQSVAGGQVTVWTPGGLALNMVELFWPLAAEAAGFLHPEQQPVFLNLETAQYYMARIVRPLLDDERLFDSVTMDRNRLYSQVLDNLNKAALVGFSHTEIADRLKSAWVGDPGQLRVYDDVQTCANLFRQYCLEHNLLDFSLQVEVFCAYLWQDPICRSFLFGSYRHLIVDNVEEDTPYTHDLLQEWLPAIDSGLVIYDEDAGYRRFLGADPQNALVLADLCETHARFDQSLVQSHEVAQLTNLLDRALAGSRSPSTELRIEPVDRRSEANESAPVIPALDFTYTRFYPQMLEWVADQTAHLVNEQGIPPGEIVILAPLLTDSLRYALMDRLMRRGIPHRSHRPSRALREEPATACLLALMAISHPYWGIIPSAYDMAYALVQAIDGMDLVRAQLLAEIVYHPKKGGGWLLPFGPIRSEVQERITYRLGERYEQLRQWIENYQQLQLADPWPPDYFLSRLFGELLSQPGFGFHTRLDAGRVSANLIQSVRSFRQTAGPGLQAEGIPVGREYLQMIREGVIAAQYLSDWQVPHAEAVLLSPAYTFLLNNRPVAIQFWLDVGSRAWAERLNQPLTHPYVLTREWEAGRVWTDSDEFNAGRQAMARVGIGLLRRCRSQLYLGLSELGEQGYEQRGPLLMAFQRVLRG